MNSTNRGCLMCDSLYLKANGEMPCWDDVGESHVLRKLDYAKLAAGKEHDLFGGDALAHIRSSFSEGRVPFPGLCEFCDVRNHGAVATAARPHVMRILHIESSYLCHLSCPLCIAAKDRKHMVAPPYSMPPLALDGLLRQLKAEGLGGIGIVHFEGRGDPMMNPHLGEMIQITHRHFPDTTTMVTTHGSYHYKPWVVQCGLTTLRIAADGAFPQSYARYRVGGDFDLVMDFFRSVRDDRRRSNSPLRVVWKYILFEWNDSDDEIRRAVSLADELDAEMEFVLTHGPGRSKRFANLAALQQTLKRLAPTAAADATFPLKEQHAPLSDMELQEKIRSSFALARKLIRSRDERTALGLIWRALEADCGIQPSGEEPPSRDQVHRYIPFILQNARFSPTLAGLSTIFYEWDDPETGRRLLQQYLRVAIDIPGTNRFWIALRLKLQFRSHCRRIRHQAVRNFRMLFLTPLI